MVVHRLRGVQTAGAVVGAATGVVRAPAEPDVDPVVGEVADLVVGDGRPVHVGGQDSRHVHVVDRDRRHEVVVDHDVADGHPGIGRVVGIGADTADDDGTPGELGEQVVLDEDVRDVV